MMIDRLVDWLWRLLGRLDPPRPVRPAREVAPPPWDDPVQRHRQSHGVLDPRQLRPPANVTPLRPEQLARVRAAVRADQERRRER